MHAGDKEPKMINQQHMSSKKFVPKVSPTDFHRFIYKCHLCMLGFKRRGMLVNHLAKRHPDINMESVPELNLPILKTQKDYYCQYCEKVYKSSSKRKAHILKNHPGSVLPVSARKKIVDIPGLPNPTYSQTVGSITTMPHSCVFCHKQYASKAKLTQHQRKKHPDLVTEQNYTPKTSKNETKEVQPAQEPHQTREQQQSGTIQHLVRFVEGDSGVVACIQQSAGQEGLPSTDLLTQAMSELTHHLQPVQEYRSSLGELATVTSRPGATTMVQVQNLPSTHSTIEFSHLSQALSSAQFLPSGHISGTPIQLTAIATSAGEQIVDHNLQVITSPTQSPIRSQANQESQNIASTQAGVSMQTIPVTLPPGTIISQNWAAYNQRFNR